MKRKQTNSNILYFTQTPADYNHFCHSLKMMTCLPENTRTPVFLCIGTDRMTGDCLGPLIGHRLEQYFSGAVPVFGTLRHPVHALNLEQTIAQIHRIHPDAFLIVIDAALGLPEHIGSITLRSGSLSPGQGMRKKLPSVGDLSITGIVSSCLGNVTLLLQSTRFYLVHELAEYIVTGLIQCFSPDQ